MSFNFEKLEVYKKAIIFAGLAYKVTKSFPKDELFGLTSQLKRASLSVSANIAEGSSGSFKQFGNYLDIARGSVFECVALLQVASNEKYINKQTFDELYQQCESLSKMMSALKRSLVDKNKSMNHELRTMNGG